MRELRCEVCKKVMIKLRVGGVMPGVTVYCTQCKPTKKPTGRKPEIPYFLAGLFSE